jgi:pimeloyl-ACP methyl ester carboxylesterase
LAVLIIRGGAADADGSNTLATHLESDFTILSFDRRGLSRSVPKTDATPLGVNRNSRDASIVLAEVTSEPAFVFSVSIVALIGLDLVTTHPIQIRMLVAHEPPLKQLLPPDELDNGLHEQEEVKVAFGNEGVRAAMMKSLQHSGVNFGDREADVPAPQLSPYMADNLQFFLSNDAPVVRQYQIDPSLLEEERSKVIPSAGETSTANWPNRCAARLADQLRVDLVHFPEGHNA